MDLCIYYHNIIYDFSYVVRHIKKWKIIMKQKKTKVLRNKKFIVKSTVGKSKLFK